MHTESFTPNRRETGVNSSVELHLVSTANPMRKYGAVGPFSINSAVTEVRQSDDPAAL